MNEADWLTADALTLLLVATDDTVAETDQAAAVLINRADRAFDFHLPVAAAGSTWRMLYTSGSDLPGDVTDAVLPMAAYSIACCCLR